MGTPGAFGVRQMTQRIHDRLHNELNLDNEILVKAFRTGRFVDQFSSDFYPKANLKRLPKCMNPKKPIDKKK